MSIIFLFFYSFLGSLSLTCAQAFFPNLCEERCGPHLLPFPFHLNSSCGPPIEAFRLSCAANSSSLYLTLGHTDLRIIGFLSSGSILIDYSLNASSLYSSASSSSCDRWYSDLTRSSLFDHSPFYSVTQGNILRLYDCEDSSLCRTGCDTVGAAGGCDVNNRTDFGCCYPLSDGSVWKQGNGFSVFEEFGCRGFSCWVVNQSVAVRGIEVEWAVPKRNRSGVQCAEGAVLVNATAVKGGFRCACSAGFVGDGFADGAGCFKACSDDGRANGNGDCCKGKFCTKRAVALTGLSVSAFFVAIAVAFWFLLRQPMKEAKFDQDLSCIPKILSKACNTRQFTYEELNDATKGFEEHRKLIDFVEEGTVHTGTLDDGSIVAIQKVNCETGDKLGQLMERVQLLSRISHRNIAQIIGFCFESNNSILLVHEHFANGTLEENLKGEKGHGLSWYSRVNIAAEIASALAYLQCLDSSPICLNVLKTSEILLGLDFEAKISGYKLIRSGLVAWSSNLDTVYNFGCMLIELMTGSKHEEYALDMVLTKVKERKFHELMDPFLVSNKQLRVQYEEVERVGDLVSRCLLNKEHGNGDGICMAGVAKELMCILRENMGSCSSRIEISLEETFSNSSLLQMISLSPESLRV